MIILTGYTSELSNAEYVQGASKRKFLFFLRQINTRGSLYRLISSISYIVQVNDARIQKSSLELPSLKDISIKYIGHTKSNV